MSSEGRFGRFDFTMVVTGLFLYVGDVGTDLWVALSFWREGRVVWFALVLGSMLLAAVTIQIFSLSWHCDDQKQSRQNGSESQPPPCHHYCRMPFLCLGLLHVFQMGIPVRIFLVLKCGYMTAFKDQDDHWKAIYLATDLSMLRLFEAFLETAPQLILQTFILLQYEHRNYIQYLSVIASCTSISWATLDYYVALRKSLPLKKKLVCGLPYVTYVLYNYAKNTDVEESNNLNNGTGSEVYYDEVDGNLSNGQNENSQRNHEADTYHKRKYLRQKMFLLE
eukprot:gi/632940826/ref/XP_007885525.1/ PREDICTED: XK-related protein 9 [Callorhinchus milii]